MAASIHARVAVLLCCGLLLCGRSIAAPEVEVGAARGSPGAIVPVPVYFVSAPAATAGLQLDLRYDAARLAPETAKPGAALLDHRFAGAVPAQGTYRALFHSPSRSGLVSGELLSLPFTIAPDAPAGDLSLTAEDVLIADANGATLPPSRITSGKVTVVAAPGLGETLTVEGTALDGRPDRTVVFLSGLNSVIVRYRRVAPGTGGCRIMLRILTPGGATLGPLELQELDSDVQLNGKGGNWTFLVSTSGGCTVAQSFHLEIHPSGSVLGTGTALLVAATLVFLAAMLRGRIRGRRGRGW